MIGVINVLERKSHTGLLAFAVSLVAALILSVLAGIAADEFHRRDKIRRHQDGLPRRIADIILTVMLVLPPTFPSFFAGYFRNAWITPRTHGGGTLSFCFAILSAIVVSFPLVYRLAQNTARRIDPMMVTTARSIGLSEAKIRSSIVRPQIRGRILGGFLLCLGRFLGEYCAATVIIAGIGQEKGSFPERVRLVMAGGDYLRILLIEIAILTVFFLAGGLAITFGSRIKRNINETGT